LGNVWVYSAPQWNGKIDKQVHPSQKPVMLLERLILLSSNQGDTVVDPFMGSGSTGVAAIMNDRKFYGCEMNSDYFEIALNRLNEVKK
jgi:site-specific DNA-methyltransferase (adenine-specific)